jgi:hypothetical protein
VWICWCGSWLVIWVSDDESSEKLRMNMGICYFPKDIESNPKSQVEYKKVAVVVRLIFQFNIYECN